MHKACGNLWKIRKKTALNLRCIQFDCSLAKHVRKIETVKTVKTLINIGTVDALRIRTFGNWCNGWICRNFWKGRSKRIGRKISKLSVKMLFRVDLNFRNSREWYYSVNMYTFSFTRCLVVSRVAFLISTLLLIACMHTLYSKTSRKG